jgi:TRAP-type C4-dicarboxylate transport system substrate-binding protein
MNLPFSTLKRALGALAASLLLAQPAWSQVTLKFATLVPERSSYYAILKSMTDSWAQLSGGRIKVILYPGGRQGDDPDVVRKLRLGTLQGALLASPGLAEIDRSVYAMSIPLAFDSTEEVYAALERMRPGLEAAMEAKGFVALAWADGGWLRFFSRKPVAAPDDLRHQKLFQWAGDPRSLEVWKAAGFNAIAAPAPELATGLQTGLLDAFLASPQVAVVTRYYEQAPNMTDLKWSIVLTGLVVGKDAWAKVPQDLRPVLQKSAREAADRLRADMRASDEKDLQALRGAGLKVIPVDARNRDLWQKTVASATGKIRGETVPAPAYDEALRVRDELRRKPKGGK